MDLKEKLIEIKNKDNLESLHLPLDELISNMLKQIGTIDSE